MSFEADNLSPAAVQASLNNTTMTWNQSGSNDVLGTMFIKWK